MILQFNTDGTSPMEVEPARIPSSFFDHDSASCSRSTSSQMNRCTEDKRRVQHDYHDHARVGGIRTNNKTRKKTFIDSPAKKTPTEAVVSSDDEQSKKSRRGPRGGVAVPFPDKLHHMLTQVEREDLSHIVSWQAHGRCFVVHNAKEFVATIMPKFFRQTKLTSFQRQLNLYGFCRLTSGRDRGGYYHELFLYGRPFLCKQMMRTRIKGTGIKAASSPNTEPDFYSMSPVTGMQLNGDVESIATQKTSCESISLVSIINYVPVNVSPPLLQQPSITFIPPPAAMVNMNKIVTPPTTPSQGPAIMHLVHPSKMSLNEADVQPDELIAFEGQHFHYLDPSIFDRKLRESADAAQLMVIGCDYLVKHQPLNHDDVVGV